jgi:hypothetical protein
MTAPRARLADRRLAETFELEVCGLHYTCTVGRFPDGSVGEVFLQNHKPGSQSDFNARDSAVAASLALQHGCPLEVLRRAVLRDPRGNASTPLGAALDRNRGARAMTVVRLPPRRMAAVFVCEERSGGWLVLAGSHGWIHGDRRAALADAHWLGWNLGLPVREAL